MPFAGGTQHTGYFNLPDLQNFYKPGTPPFGGYDSFSAMAQSKMQAHRYSDANLYIMRTTLEKFRALAENVYSAIQLRTQQQAYGTLVQPKSFQRNYEKASFDPNTQLIHGLPKQEIVGGDYPQLRNEELMRGQKLGVLLPDPAAPSQMWAINIAKLREEMAKLRQQLEGQEYQYKAIDHLAGKADQAFNASLQGNTVPNITSTI